MAEIFLAMGDLNSGPLNPVHSTLDHLATLDPLVCLFVFAFLSVFIVSACERLFSSSGTQLQKLFLF